MKKYYLVALLAFSSLATSAQCVNDNVAPTVVSKDIILSPGSNGSVTLLPEQVDSASSDNCGIASLSVSPNFFTCADEGPNLVTLTATDSAGNSASSNAWVTIQASCSGSINLNSWSQQGVDSTGNWLVASDGESLQQTINANPTFYISPDDYFNTVIEGEISVETGVDDDFIGFVLGYQDPLGANENAHEFILFDWKQRNQYKSSCGGYAPAQMTLSRVSGSAFSESDYYEMFWCKNVPEVEVLATNSTMGGWQDFTDYKFRAEYFANSLKIYINDVLVFEEYDTFQNGKFGFYNFSQPNVRYSGFNQPFDISAQVENACPNQLGSINVQASSAAPGPYTYIWSNGYTGGANQNGLSAGSYWVEVEAANCCVVRDTFYISDQDTAAPVILANNYTLTLDANGNGSISFADVDQGSYDDCGIASISLSQTQFDCSHVNHENGVLITATDHSGNQSQQWITVYVEDLSPAIPANQMVTTYLNRIGQASISLSDFSISSGSSCGLDSAYLSQTDFACADVGIDTIQIIQIDDKGNTSSTDAFVQVLDTLPPAMCCCKPDTVELASYGEFWIDDNFVADHVAARDNCTPVSFHAFPNMFGEDDLGSNTVWYVGTDENGNADSCQTTILVLPPLPIARCKDITVLVDEFGQVQVDPSQVDNGSHAFGGIQQMLLTPNTFSCNELGENQVELIVFNTEGESDTCTATVTVEKLCAAPIDLNTWVQEGDSTFGDWTVDSLGGSVYQSENDYPTFFVSPNSYINTSLAGSFEVQSSVDDDFIGFVIGYQSPASSTASGDYEFILFDWKQGTQFKSSCNGTAQAGMQLSRVNGSAYGKNDIYSMFWCKSTPGIEVLDSNFSFGGWQDYTTYNFKVDYTATEVTVYINGVEVLSTTGTFSPGRFGFYNFSQPFVQYNSFTEEFNAMASKLDPTCPNAQDGSASVAVSGAPNAQLSYLWSTGDTTASISNLNAGTYTVEVSAANCCVAYDTITLYDQDTIAPVAIAKDTLIVLTENDSIVLSASQLDNGSYDNCDLTSLVLIPNTFTCADEGPNTVQLIATDAAGNVDTTTAIVTIEIPCSAPINLHTWIQEGVSANGNWEVDSLGESVSQKENLNPTFFVSTDTYINTVIEGSFSVQTGVDNDFVGFVLGYQDPSGTATGNHEFILFDWKQSDQYKSNCGGWALGEMKLSKVNGPATTTTELYEMFWCKNQPTVEVLASNASMGGWQDFATYNFKVAYSTTNLKIWINGTLVFDENGTFPAGRFGFYNFSQPKVQYNSFEQSFDVNIQKLDASCPGSTDGTATAIVSGAPDVNVTYLWSNGATTQAVENLQAGTYWVEVSAGACCIARDTVQIFDQDTLGPIAKAKDLTLYANENCSVNLSADMFDDGSSDNCDLDTLYINKYHADSLGVYTIILTAKDASGNISSDTVLLTVLDSLAPTASCVDNLDLYLDENGEAGLSANDVDNGSSDNCSAIDFSLSQNEFDCTHLGANQLILTVTDQSGNSASCTTVVNVIDTISPKLSAADFTSYLDENGNSSVSLNDFNPHVTDNCGIDTIILNKEDFSCSEIGTNSVSIIAKDASGNLVEVNQTLTVLDTISPTVNCANDTLILDENGLASLDTAAVLLAYADNCGVENISISKSQFGNTDVGTQNITISIIDSSGNTSQCSPLITIISPEPEAVCKDAIVYLDENGEVSISVNAIDNGSSAVGGIASMQLSQANFNCSDLGSNTVKLIVESNYGGFDTCTATVEVIDTVSPIISCVDLTVYLNGNGEATIDTSMLSAYADNCGISDLSISKSLFTCSDVGVNQVEFTATDASGNSSACSATVTVIDTNAVQANCKDITLYLDANGATSFQASDLFNGGQAACGIDTMIACVEDCYTVDFNSMANGTPIPVGTAITNQLAGFGISSVSATGGINKAWSFDSSNPTQEDRDLGTPNQQYGGPGVGSAGVSNNTSMGNLLIIQENHTTPDDNGSGGTISMNFSNFPSIQTITFIDIEEAGGTVEVQTASGLVVAHIQNPGDNSKHTIQVNADSAISMVVNMPGSGAIGEIEMCSGCTTSFSCEDIGTHQASLTVFDNNGNSSSCTAQVTVLDSISPVAVGQNLSFDLATTNPVIISPEMVNVGSSDNCEIVDISISHTEFDCDDIGDNQVTLTVTDASGNVGTTTVIVQIEDSEAGISLNCTPDLNITCNNAQSTVEWPAPTVSSSSSACSAAICSDTVKAGFIYMGTYNGNMYFCSDNSNYTWTQAQQHATSNGGTLLEIDDASENSFIKSIMVTNYLWIGLTDNQNEGNFVWNSGASSSYRNWKSGEPNNQSSNCGTEADYTVIGKTNGQWYDRANCEQYEFIMEVPCAADGITVEQVSGPTNGSQLSAGTYTVEYLAYNADSSLTATCAFNINVAEYNTTVTESITAASCTTNAQQNCDCEGRMQQFTVKYTGSSGVDIKLYDKSKSTVEEVFYNVQDGDVIVANGYESDGRFESKVFLKVVGTSTFHEVHTSCSIDIMGMQIGPFEVLGYIDGAGNECGGIPCDGTIDITVSGTASPYTFLWSNGANTEDLHDVCPGDYTVLVSDNNGCSASYTYTVGTAGGGLTANCQNTSISMVNGTASLVAEQVDNGSTWDCGPVHSMTVSPNTFTAAGQYNVTLTVYDDLGNSESCNATVTVVNEPCAASASSTQYEWIQSIQIGGMQNVSGNNGGYGDFTSQSHSLLAGQAHNVSLSPGFSDNSYDEYWKIWMDLNHDGDFDDVGEKVFWGSGTSTVTGSLTIPTSALGGPTRMRIFMKWKSYPSGPCDNYTYGEVEDYLVNVTVPEGGVVEQPVLEEEPIQKVSSIEFIALYPNPALISSSNQVHIEFRSAYLAEMDLYVRDITGANVIMNFSRIALEGKNKWSINTSNIAPGNYMLQLYDEKGSVEMKPFIVVE